MRENGAEVTRSELSKRISIPGSRLSGLLDVAESKGLIKRVIKKEGRGRPKVITQLTEKGEKVSTENKDFDTIRKLIDYPVEDVVNLSKLVYLKQRMKSANEKEIRRKARQAFFLSNEEIKRAMNIYEEISDKGIEKTNERI